MKWHICVLSSHAAIPGPRTQQVPAACDTVYKKRSWSKIGENIAEIYLIMDRSEWHLSLNSIPNDEWYSQITPQEVNKWHVFFAIFTIFPYFLLGNLWISDPSLGILSKLRHHSDLSIIKYISAILFCR